MSDEKLKFASDRIMDFFDDVVLNVPGKTKEERIVDLARVVQLRLAERIAEVKGVAPAPGEEQERIHQFNTTLLEDPRVFAVLNMRLTTDGLVLPAVATKDMAFDKSATFQAACTDAIAIITTSVFGRPFHCGCKTCATMKKERRGLFMGPKAEA